MPSNDLYSTQNQFDIRSITLYREGATEKNMFELKEMLEEANIYESLDGMMSASLMIVDPFNIPDTFPLLGGERIRIQYKTPSMQEYSDMLFVVHRVGESVSGKDNSKAIIYELSLVPLDVYNNASSDISKSYKGRYSDIVDQLLNDLGSTRQLEKEDSLGIQKFVSPFWTPLHCCHWVSGRSYDANNSPFLFYETVDGYRFKALKTLFESEVYRKLRIEPKTADPNPDPDRLYSIVYEYEPLPRDSKMEQQDRGLFGSTTYVYSTLNKTIQKQEASYADLPKVDKFKLYDDVAGKRNKVYVLMERADGSHRGAFSRRMQLGLLDNTRANVMIAGDSLMRAGYVIELNVPSKAATPELVHEVTTSGRWLVTSVRHVIRRDSYRTIIGIAKDSYSSDIAGRIKV